jgi:hypothetical protein
MQGSAFLLMVLRNHQQFSLLLAPPTLVLDQLESCERGYGDVKCHGFQLCSPGHRSRARDSPHVRIYLIRISLLYCFHFHVRFHWNYTFWYKSQNNMLTTYSGV